MKYLELKMLNCEEMEYKIVNNADHTDTILLKGIFNCLDTNLSVLSLFNFMSDIPVIRLSLEDDLVEVSYSDSINEALSLIKDSIVNLYESLYTFNG